MFAAPVARLALAAGGHLRVGLEDDPRGTSNVELVARAAELAAAEGRDLATPDEAAAIMGLPAREGAR